LRFRETLALILLLVLGLGVRLVFIWRFPTIPVSDFHNLLTFGLYLRDHGLINDARWFWRGFNPGLPLVLWALSNIFPGADPAALARVATAVLNGFLPLVPFVIWRGILSLRVRFLAGAALALWPGQVLFSGVVAQDNWVILPSLALGALAVRALARPDRAWPVTAGVLYAVGAAMRADMMLPLFPLLLAAIRVDLLRTRWRTAAAGTLGAGLALLALAGCRYAASGRFALAPQHGGLSLLGVYVPGSSQGWVEPYPFVASVDPDLLEHPDALLAKASGLALREAMRRPAFHLLRIVSTTGLCAIRGEFAAAHWSLEAEGTLPPGLRERGARLALALRPLVSAEMLGIQALFLVTLVIGIRRRDSRILIVASAVALKYGMHAIGVAEGRFLFVATGWEILAIAIALEDLLERRTAFGARQLAGWLLAAGLFNAGLFYSLPQLAAYVEAHDTDRQRTYHFEVHSQIDSETKLSCVVNHGLLASLGFEFPPMNATIRTRDNDPPPGDFASAACDLTASGTPRPVVLQILDPYERGGLPGRMIQRVMVDNAEVFAHDIAGEPGGGWADIPLGNAGDGTKTRIVIEIRAIHPDPGFSWGAAGGTEFRLRRP
jgi:hypothetical protein